MTSDFGGELNTTSAKYFGEYHCVIIKIGHKVALESSEQSTATHCLLKSVEVN